MLLIILEFTNVFIFRPFRVRTESIGALSVEVVIFELADICIAVCKSQGALSIEIVIFKLPSIFFAVRKSQGALSIEIVVFELANIFMEIGRASCRERV